MTPQPFLELSHAAAEQHGLQPGRRVTAHRVVVKGSYLAKPPLRDAAGAAARSEIPYSEAFELPPSEHLMVAHNALSHVLGKDLLADAIKKKDPNFRGVKTHEVASHENVLEPEDEFRARTPDSQPEPEPEE